MSSKDCLATVISRCQQLARPAEGLHPAGVGERLRSLSAGLPGNLAIRERIAIRDVLIETVTRVARASGLGQRQALHTILFEGMARDIAAATWRTDVASFLNRCADAFTLHAMTPGPADVRAARALQMIADRYGDRSITLSAIADHARLSQSHLSRLLKQTTGLGFITLLHRTRIAAAQLLLEIGRLSVKEIATAVGYSTSSQFCRHFKRHTRTTPTRYRATHIARIA